MSEIKPIPAYPLGSTPTKMTSKGFDKASHDPLAWRVHAISNRAAADVLWKATSSGKLADVLAAGTQGTKIDTTSDHWKGVERPAVMLFGFAVECLLKGLKLAKGYKSPKEGTLKGSELLTHDLIALADGEGIALDPAERVLLAELTRYVTDAGRYPVGKSCSDTPKGQGLASFTDETVGVLFDRLLGMLDAKCPPG